MKFLLKWAICSAVWFALAFGGVQFDLAFNREMVEAATFRWAQFLTTKHALTILYLDSTSNFLLAVGIFAAIFGALLAFYFSSRGRRSTRRAVAR